MEDYFNFLPEEKEGVIFLDNCAFHLGEGVRESIRFVSREEKLCEEVDRLSNLMQKLSCTNNWVTIKEVVGELKENIEGLEYLRERATNKKLINAVERAVHLYKRAHKLIREEKRDALFNLTDGLAEKINSFWLPRVGEIFKQVRGKTNSENTDCKLVATALVYAEKTPTYMFSYDIPLLDTYSICAVRAGCGIKNTYILDEERKMVRPTKRYYFNRHLNRLSIRIIPH